MRALTNYLTALVDYAKAELDDLRRKVIKSAVGTAILLLAGIFALWGTGLFFAALFIWITHCLGATVAALITGGAALVVACVVAAIGLWLAK